MTLSLYLYGTVFWICTYRRCHCIYMVKYFESVHAGIITVLIWNNILNLYSLTLSLYLYGTVFLNLYISALSLYLYGKIFEICTHWHYHCTYMAQYFESALIDVIAVLIWLNILNLHALALYYHCTYMVQYLKSVPIGIITVLTWHTPYPPSYGLNSSTIVLQGEWIWH